MTKRKFKNFFNYILVSINFSPFVQRICPRSLMVKKNVLKTLLQRGRKISWLIKDCSTNMWHVIYKIKGRSNASRIIVLEINRCTILLILGNCIFMEAIQYRKILIYTKIVVNKCVLFSLKNQLLEFICILNSVQSVNILRQKRFSVIPCIFHFLV